MRMIRMNWGAVGTIVEWTMVTLSRLPFSWRAVSALVLGVLLAKWFWILFAPHSIFTAAVPEGAAGIEASQLFGKLQTSDSASQGVALPNVKLLGIFSANAGKPGFAILKLDDNRQVGVAEGEEVAPGTKLVAVSFDHVVLERAGVQQQVNLENKYSGSSNKGVLPANKEDPRIRQNNDAIKKYMDKNLPSQGAALQRDYTLEKNRSDTSARNLSNEYNAASSNQDDDKK